MLYKDFITRFKIKIYERYFFSGLFNNKLSLNYCYELTFSESYIRLIFWSIMRLSVEEICRNCEQ